MMEYFLLLSFWLLFRLLNTGDRGMGVASINNLSVYEE